MSLYSNTASTECAGAARRRLGMQSPSLCQTSTVFTSSLSLARTYEWHTISYNYSLIVTGPFCKGSLFTSQYVLCSECLTTFDRWSRKYQLKVKCFFFLNKYCNRRDWSALTLYSDSQKCGRFRKRCFNNI